MYDVAATEMVDRLQVRVVIPEQPRAVREDACVFRGRDHLWEWVS